MSAHINPLLAGADHAPWQIVQTQTLAASASTVTFTGLDGDKAYRYRVFGHAETEGIITAPLIQLNNDTGANYNYLTAALGASYAGTTNTDKTSFALGIGVGADTVVLLDIEILSTTGGKVLRSITSSSTSASVSQTIIATGDWTGSNPVTEIDLLANGASGAFAAGSRFDLLAMGLR